MYSVSGNTWTKGNILSEHTQLVADLDWGPRTGQLLSASHDRNAFVWKNNGDVWEPVLVVLRLKCAALCARWSPSEGKFAIGSGAKTVCVCYYEPENNWWVSKHIRKKHNSSVVSVAWHPNNLFLATTSSDMRCRVFSAFIKGVDSDSSPLEGVDKFGDEILDLDLASGWAHSVSFSPSGSQLAYVSHDSSLHYVRGLAATATGMKSGSSTTLRFSEVPYCCIAWLSETSFVAAGYDCSPVVFEADASGNYVPVKLLKAKGAGSGAAAGNKSSQFSSAFDKFRAQAERGLQELSVSDTRDPIGPHKNIITTVQVCGPGKISTSGLDGQVVVWNL